MGNKSQQICWSKQCGPFTVTSCTTDIFRWLVKDNVSLQNSPDLDPTLYSITTVFFLTSLKIQDIVGSEQTDHQICLSTGITLRP